MIAQRVANLSHDVVDVSFGIDHEIGMPELVHDVLARNQLLAPANQEDQQLHGLLLKLHPVPGAAQLVTSEIELNVRPIGISSGAGFAG
jgi:hypothetical protein